MLNELEIFATEQELYININDNQLIKISGKDKPIVEKTIEFIKHHNDIEVVFNKNKDAYHNDKNYFNSIINFLVESNIVKIEVDTDIISKRILLIANINKDYFEKELIKCLNRSNLLYHDFKIVNPYNENIYENYLEDGFDIIIVLSPCSNYYLGLEKLSDSAYEKNIPILHCGISNSILTIGPIVDPQLNTPSLFCYFKRKAASINNLDDFLSTITIENKKNIHSVFFTKNSYLDILFNFVGNELEKYFVRGKSSLIIGNEIEFNCINYNTKRTKILKTF